MATEAELAPIVVKAQGPRSGLARHLPSSSASKSAEELREQNLFNPEDALKYIPNTSIRKRYIGDRNAMIGGRSFGTLQPSRGLAYVDGYLISNFLGRFDGPRWNMVTPEAIARVDTLYGPFSALYPGNSIGTTVVITEREPQAFEASVRVTGASQRFSQYGDADDYGSGQLSAYLGNRLDSGLWYSASFNHQNSTSQPMNYYALVRGTPPSGVTPTPVTGIAYDLDPKGQPRAIAGASGGAIDHTVQDAVKFKLGYRFTPEVLASAMLGFWRNDSEMRNRTFLRDAAGNPVWSGWVSDGASSYNVPATAFAPSTREEQHRHGGLTLKTQHATGWNGSLVYSNYRMTRDALRQANVPDPQAAQGGSGSVTRRDGTGWNTLELQANYTPVAGDWGDGRHALTFGLHRNGYQLISPTREAAYWQGDEGALTQRYQGRTEVLAAYAQDAWKLRDDLTLTMGVRQEQFSATEGAQYGRFVQSGSCPGTLPAGSTCVDNGTTPASFTLTRDVPYADRHMSGTSPKASLAWRVDRDLTLKVSAGRGVRFPNVEELYNGTVEATSLTQSDPNLLPEKSNALEFSAEQRWADQRLRTSLFYDDVRDAILRQTDVTVTPKVTRYSNVDRVKTRGVEFDWQAFDLGLRGLSLSANAAFAHAKVVANAKDPSSVGQYWLRVPKVRANVLAAYRPSDLWMASVGVRHSGRAYNDVYNQDTNPNVYGGVSSFTFLDLRASYQLDKNVGLSVGVDNVLDQRAYQAHPYPGRTFFLELRGSY